MANNALNRTAIPLRSTAAGELGRSLDAASPANGAADTHPLVVDALPSVRI